MKALVLGCGSIGFRHIGHLQQLGLTDLEAADPNPAAREKAKNHWGIPVGADADQALSRRPDMVFICTPASTHVELALKSLAAGAHVFVEKPLSVSFEKVRPLLERRNGDGRMMQVGYNLRYHPAMKAAKQVLDSGRMGKILAAHAEFGLYLKKWWPGRDYRNSYMATAEEGGGLLLDVSHEIDLMIWFLGPVLEVSAQGGRLSGLEMEGMDLIKVLMRMESGALASLSMDCLQPAYTRGFTLTGEDSALRWHCSEGRADTSVGQMSLCESSSEKFASVKISGNPQETYVEELRDFISSIETGRQPACGWKEGAEVLRVVEAIRRSIEKKRTVKVSECR